MKLDMCTIRQAQQGDAESLAHLTEQVNRRVFTYIYRLTLDYHLAEDLSQDTVLVIVKALPVREFAHANTFWAWVYRSALGKVQHHFRLQGNRRLQTKTVVDSDRVAQCERHADSGINTLIREELRNAIIEAMNRLKLRHRSILTLRCFENLSYADIAGIMGGSEVQARLLFLRAKLSLKRQLALRGFKKDHLLSALGIFALVITHPAEKASASVGSAQSLSTGLGKAILGWMGTKAAVVVVSSVFVASVGTGVLLTGGSKTFDPYAELWPLLDNNDFSYPTAVTRTFLPPGKTFWAADLDNPSEAFVPIHPQEVLVGPRVDHQRRLVLPAKHTVDLAFAGNLMDGPGPDLFYVGFGCRPLRVVLLGANGERVVLPISDCSGRCSPDYCQRDHLVAFDFADLKIPFTPTQVRIRGLYGPTPAEGIQIQMIKARIQP